MELVFNSDTDLRIERQMKAGRDAIWRCWTDRELFVQWFAPKPVRVSDVEFEFIPGGSANLTMTLPDGTVMPLRGCVLEVEPATRLITTDAMTDGFRPAAEPFMTTVVEMIDSNGGTLYRATVLHNSAEAKKRHEDMGFEEGWGTVFKQLDDLSASL